MSFLLPIWEFGNRCLEWAERIEFLRRLVDWVRRKKTGTNPPPESTFFRIGTGASVGEFRVEGGAAQGFNRTFDIEGRLDVGQVRNLHASAPSTGQGQSSFPREIKIGYVNHPPPTGDVQSLGPSQFTNEDGTIVEHVGFDIIPADGLDSLLVGIPRNMVGDFWITQSAKPVQLSFLPDQFGLIVKRIDLARGRYTIHAKRVSEVTLKIAFESSPLSGRATDPQSTV